MCGSVENPSSFKRDIFYLISFKFKLDFIRFNVLYLISYGLEFDLI